MNANRKPAAFRLDGAETDKNPKPAGKEKRAPRAIRDETAIQVSITEDASFDQEIAALDTPSEPPGSGRRIKIGAIFFGATGLFLSLAIGLWVEGIITDFFARAPWLGWLATGLAATAGLALFALFIRELLALLRLSSVETLRVRAADISSRGDLPGARRLVGDLVTFTRDNPSTARGRKVLSELQDDIIDAADLIGIAERELFSGLDQQAKDLVMQSAKRVSVVTAVSPRALIDVGFVLFEAGRLIRRISLHYGGRPGTLGFFKLIRDVAAHLAVTGSIAVGDSLIQQLVGHGLAAKLSARLGEGVVNGLMTVRIGIAAMETARPLPFKAVNRPGVSEFLSNLAGSAATKNEKE